MTVHYRTLGLILKKEDQKEADRVFSVYTENFGKLELLAKGERKIESKLRGGLELFYLSEIEFIQGKTYKTLTDAILIDNFKNLRKNLRALSVAHKISEVLDNLVKGQEPDEKIWQLILETFDKLNNLSEALSHRASVGSEGRKENEVLFDHRASKGSEGRKENEVLFDHRASVGGEGRKENEILFDRLSLLYYYFFWNFLSILGYKPELNLCAICKKNLTPERLYFNLEEGGIICGSCSKKIKNEEKIEPETIKILRILLKRDWQTLLRLKIDPIYRKSLKKFSEDYYSYLPH